MFTPVFNFGCISPQSVNRDSSTAQDQVPAWPPPPQQARIKYLKSIASPSDMGTRHSLIQKIVDSVFGESTTSDRLLRPYGIFVSSDRIYVTDPGLHLLHIFDLDKNLYINISRAGNDDLISPIGVAVNRKGDIYLSDSMLKKVIVFDANGKYLNTIGRPDSFFRPTGIALDEERIYIVDTYAHCVLVFDNKGRFLFSFGQNGGRKGEFNYPTNIFIGSDGLLYITDSMNFRIQIFDRDGNFRSSFGKLGDGTGYFAKPKGVAVDSEGNIYVADAEFDTIQIFDRDGALLLNFGSTGTDSGQMILPSGLFIDKKDRIYVADSYNHRVQIFQFLKEN